MHGQQNIKMCPPNSAPHLHRTDITQYCLTRHSDQHAMLFFFFLFSLDCTSYLWDNPTMGSWLDNVKALCVVKGPEFPQKMFTTGHILNSLSASYGSWLVLPSHLSNSLLSSSYGTCFILTSKNDGTDHNCLNGRSVGRSLSVYEIFVPQLVFRTCVTHSKYWFLSQHSYTKPWFPTDEVMKENSKGIWICGHTVSVTWF